NAADVERDHWTSDDAPAAKYIATGGGVRSSRSQLNQRGCRGSRQSHAIQRQKFFFFFTWSRIVFQHQKPIRVYCPPEQLSADFRVSPGIRYRRGEVIARGAVDTGDQVFVDKFSYNFVKPHRGDVFVFRTRNIPDIGDQSQFYIKRLAGLPGD